jgi:hypothetical protein
MTDRTFYSYIRLADIGDKPFGSIWSSGFKLRSLGPVHGRWSALGEFRCVRDA